MEQHRLLQHGDAVRIKSREELERIGVRKRRNELWINGFVILSSMMDYCGTIAYVIDSPFNNDRVVQLHCEMLDGRQNARYWPMAALDGIVAQATDEPLDDLQDIADWEQLFNS